MLEDLDANVDSAAGGMHFTDLSTPCQYPSVKLRSRIHENIPKAFLILPE